jgi:hypothetical protein
MGNGWKWGVSNGIYQYHLIMTKIAMENHHF